MKVRCENEREVLDIIDDFLAEGPEMAARRLWDVLTALRGPDDEKADEVKSAYTARIRGAAFPRCAAKADRSPFNASGPVYHNGFEISVEPLSRNPVREQFFKQPVHFITHTQRAIAALEDHISKK